MSDRALFKWHFIPSVALNRHQKDINYDENERVAVLNFGLSTPLLDCDVSQHEKFIVIEWQ